MIPSGGDPFVPIVLFVAADLLFGLICAALFFTVFLDRPHLRVRRKAAVAEVVFVSTLAIVGVLAPYEGEDGRRCTSALLTYGFRADALSGQPQADPCAMTGQLLVVFGAAILLAVVLLAGLARWAGDS